MRTIVVRAYVTEAEYVAFHALAHARSITLSTHIRAALLRDAEAAGLSIGAKSLAEKWSQEELALESAENNLN